jgi:DNA-binding beta-propeller fold protein YncE
LLDGSFITDGTDKNIKMPYGILVNPSTNEIYVTDAKDYVSSGTLYCFDKHGKKKWSVTTGDIPAHIVLIPRIQ